MTYDDNDQSTLPENADHLQNDARTCEPCVTGLTQSRSGFDLSRGLTKLYRKVGPLTPAGHRISNILELIRQPKPHAGILATQMRDLQRLLGV